MFTLHLHYINITFTLHIHCIYMSTHIALTWDLHYMSITITLHLYYIYRACTSYLHYTYVTSPSHSHYMYIAFRVHDIAPQTLHTRYTIHYMHPYIYAMLRGAAFLHALGLGCWFELVLGWDTPIDLPFVLRRIHDPQFVGASEGRSAAVRSYEINNVFWNCLGEQANKDHK